MEIRKHIDDTKQKKHKIQNCDAILIMVTPKPKELTAIRKRCTVKSRGGRGLGTTFNEERFNRECMKKFIIGWENIELDGKPLEVTIENKIQCDDNWPQFNECWNDVVMGVDDDDEIESEAEVKNS